ncbi:MAG: hypothetical protein IKU47_06035, partial [Oscillospiraceae bacterium]|nr:hypothetical protein [Oscillospiraceae bacterium]
YHEAGHAVATYVCETSSPVKEISIIPRGMAGGYTLSIPEEDSNYRTKKEMKDEIVTLLGGRCAEQLILEDISTGASNDLERTTAIAKAMVMRYGFSDNWAMLFTVTTHSRHSLAETTVRVRAILMQLQMKSTTKSAISWTKVTTVVCRFCRTISKNFTSLQKSL